MEDLLNEEVKATKSINSNSIYYALIVSAAMIVFTLILYIADLLLNKYFGFLSFVILIIGMVMGTLAYRDKYNDKFLSYSKSFKSAFLIGLYFSIVFFIWNFILYDFIATEVLYKMIEIKKDEILANPNMSDSQKSMQFAYMTKNSFLLWMTIGGIVMYTAISAIISLIIAAFVKREETTLF